MSALIVLCVVLFIVLSAIAFVCFFNRGPHLEKSADFNHILIPASGRLIVEKLYSESLCCNCYSVTVVLGIIHMHKQVMPCAGVVTQIKNIPGKHKLVLPGRIGKILEKNKFFVKS